MQEFPAKQPKFYTSIISINTAIRILKQNDIRVNEDQAKEILDFLYPIAKTYNLHEVDQRLIQDLKVYSNQQIGDYR